MEGPSCLRGCSERGREARDRARDQHRTIGRASLAKCGAELLGTGYRNPRDTERAGELRPVGVAQRGTDLTAVEALALVAVGVAVRAVVEDDRDGVDAVLRGG